MEEVAEEVNITLAGKKGNQGDLRNCRMLSVMSIPGEMVKKVIREPNTQKTR